MIVKIRLPPGEDPEITRQRDRLLEQWSDWFKAWHRFEASMAQVAAWPDLFTLKEKAATEWFRSSRLNENDRRKPTRIRDAELVILCLEEIAESRGEILYTLDDTLQMLLRGKKALEDGSELLEGLEAAKLEFRDVSDDVEKLREQLKKARRLSIKIINLSPKQHPPERDGIVTLTGEDLERARHGETVDKVVSFSGLEASDSQQVFDLCVYDKVTFQKMSVLDAENRCMLELGDKLPKGFRNKHPGVAPTFKPSTGYPMPGDG